jgi:hypothetical protein
MKAHRWLRHVVILTSGSVRSARGKPSTEMARVWAAHGMLIVALVPGSLGVVAAASLSHGHVGHASAHQAASGLPIAAAAYPISPGYVINNRPWMY